VPNIAAAISPYRGVRDEVRKMVGRFVEVYAACPLEVCEQRDVKGLYRKARAGELKQFTGIDDPYEAPLNPEVTLDTSQESVEQGALKVIGKLEELGWPGAVGPPANSPKPRRPVSDLRSLRIPPRRERGCRGGASFVFNSGGSFCGRAGHAIRLGACGLTFIGARG
jgi:hypothetical protein